MRRVHLIAAARPNFMKVAPLWHAFTATPDFQPVLIHAGQHFDANMSAVFLTDLQLPQPDHHLGVGSGTHAEQTATTMLGYEKIALQDPPEWVVVVGDVNSTVGAALAAAKLLVPVVHLEAGLRSGDRSMPEELNRLVTDALADVLWTPSVDADRNLEAEGIAETRITRVGNIMLDSFELVRSAVEQAPVAKELGLVGKEFAVVTLHRPSNVDDPTRLKLLVQSLLEVHRQLPIVFPMHPRTLNRLEALNLVNEVRGSGITLLPPQSYISFMNLVRHAAVVITDSGGVQEETTYLGIPCLTLRENTERPITIIEGTNRLVEPERLNREVRDVLRSRCSPSRIPPLWDGQTASRCVEDLRRRTAARR